MTGITRTPAPLSRRLALSAGLLALVVAGYYSLLALAVATVGLVALAGALMEGRDGLLSLGAFALFVAVLFSGAHGAPVGPVLAGVALSALAWDLGRTAVAVGDQLGAETDTVRLELGHAGGSGLVGALAAVAGYGIYRIAAGDHPVAAVVYLLLAAVVLLWALD